MWLLKIRVQLYKTREWKSFIATSYTCTDVVIIIYKRAGSVKRIYNTDIRRVKINAFKVVA